MKVFLSYSHNDKEFVDKLYARLVKERVGVWMDRVELNVGDSLTTKIQSAITEAGFLAVVLSQSFVNSGWCQRELNAGLLRELEEKQVIVLPVLKEKCEIPLFLRDKLYADFRIDFERGLDDLLRAIAAQTSQRIGRLDSPKYHTDFAWDFGTMDGVFAGDLHAASFAENEKFSVLSNVHILGGPRFSSRFEAAASFGLAEVVAAEALGPCAAILDTNDNHLTLQDEHWHPLFIELKTGQGSQLGIGIRCRRLGEATGHSLLFHYGSILGGCLRILDERRPPLTKGQRKAMESLPPLPWAEPPKPPPSPKRGQSLS